MPEWHMEVILLVFFFFFSYGCTHLATDISGSNIAFTCGKLSSAAEKDLFKILGTPRIEKLARVDGKPLDKALPKYLVKAAEWYHWADEGIEDLRIIDLGESFL
jgi:serine/threonine-protein kinase SRPK3